jgi:hypothetical protein
MPQLNKKTNGGKSGVFTTNWYLYKTYLHSNSGTQKPQNSKTATNIFGSTTSGSGSENLDADKKMPKFEEFLLEAIDEGLAVLGKEAKQALYFYLEKTFKMNRQDIPYRIEEFTDAVEKIFGNGARILEIQIMKCLFKKVGYTFKHYSKRKDITFNEYVTAVKMKNDEQGKDGKNQQKLGSKRNGKTKSMNSLRETRASLNWLFKGFSTFRMN